MSIPSQNYVLPVQVAHRSIELIAGPLADLGDSEAGATMRLQAASFDLTVMRKFGEFKQLALFRRGSEILSWMCKLIIGKVSVLDSSLQQATTLNGFLGEQDSIGNYVNDLSFLSVVRLTEERILLENPFRVGERLYGWVLPDNFLYPATVDLGAEMTVADKVAFSASVFRHVVQYNLCGVPFVSNMLDALKEQIQPCECVHILHVLCDLKMTEPRAVKEWKGRIEAVINFSAVWTAERVASPAFNRWRHIVAVRKCGLDPGALDKEALCDAIVLFARQTISLTITQVLALSIADLRAVFQTVGGDRRLLDNAHLDRSVIERLIANMFWNDRERSVALLTFMWNRPSTPLPALIDVTLLLVENGGNLMDLTTDLVYGHQLHPPGGGARRLPWAAPWKELRSPRQSVMESLLEIPVFQPVIPAPPILPPDSHFQSSVNTASKTTLPTANKTTASAISTAATTRSTSVSTSKSVANSHANTSSNASNTQVQVSTQAVQALFPDHDVIDDDELFRIEQDELVAAALARGENQPGPAAGWEYSATTDSRTAISNQSRSSTTTKRKPDSTATTSAKKPATAAPHDKDKPSAASLKALNSEEDEEEEEENDDDRDTATKEIENAAYNTAPDHGQHNNAMDISTSPSGAPPAAPATVAGGRGGGRGSRGGRGGRAVSTGRGGRSSGAPSGRGGGDLSHSIISAPPVNNMFAESAVARITAQQVEADRLARSQTTSSQFTMSSVVTSIFQPTRPLEPPLWAGWIAYLVWTGDGLALDRVTTDQGRLMQTLYTLVPRPPVQHEIIVIACTFPNTPWSSLQVELRRLVPFWDHFATCEHCLYRVVQVTADTVMLRFCMFTYSGDSTVKNSRLDWPNPLDDLCLSMPLAGARFLTPTGVLLEHYNSVRAWDSHPQALQQISQPGNFQQPNTANFQALPPNTIQTSTINRPITPSISNGGLRPMGSGPQLGSVMRAANGAITASAATSLSSPGTPVVLHSTLTHVHGSGEPPSSADHLKSWSSPSASTVLNYNTYPGTSGYNSAAVIEMKVAPIQMTAPDRANRQFASVRNPEDQRIQLLSFTLAILTGRKRMEEIQMGETILSAYHFSTQVLLDGLLRVWLSFHPPGTQSPIKFMYFRATKNESLTEKALFLVFTNMDMHDEFSLRLEHFLPPDENGKLQIINTIAKLIEALRALEVWFLFLLDWRQSMQFVFEDFNNLHFHNYPVEYVLQQFYLALASIKDMVARETCVAESQPLGFLSLFVERLALVKKGMTLELGLNYVARHSGSAQFDLSRLLTPHSTVAPSTTSSTGRISSGSTGGTITQQQDSLKICFRDISHHYLAPNASQCTASRCLYTHHKNLPRWATATDLIQLVEQGMKSGTEREDLIVQIKGDKHLQQ